MKATKYFCDLCKCEIKTQHNLGLSFDGRSVAARTRIWHLVDVGEGDYDLCIKCVTNLQAMTPKICAAGIECTGGPTCGSSHK